MSKKVNKLLGNKIKHRTLRLPISSLEINDVSNKASNLYKQGLFERSRASYLEIIATEPKSYEALKYLGLIEQHMGNDELSIEYFKKALEINNLDPQVLTGYGKALQRAKQNKEALLYFERVINSFPNHSLARIYKCISLVELEKFEDALNCLEELLKMDHEFLLPHELQEQKARIYKGLKRFEESLVAYDKVIELAPQLAGMYSNRGIVLRELGRHHEAIASYDMELKKNPGYFQIADVHSNKANALRELGIYSEAIESYERANQLDPNCFRGLFNKALVLLLLGDYQNGLSLYENRWSPGESCFKEKRDFDFPIWLGEPADLKGKSIFIYAEQGLGDTIQFSRYIKMLADLGAKVIFEVQSPLINLLSHLDGLSQLIKRGDIIPKCEFHCPLMSLPLAFGTNLDNIPPPSPFITSDKSKVALWESRIGKKRKPRIGIVWSSFSTFKHDSKRSVSLQEFIKALPDKDYEYICLQKDIKESDKATLAENPRIKFFGNLLHDFVDTAALIECVDIVVTTCTSIPHLSATLGKPTWVLLSYDPDWRWLLNRSDSPWYPAVRLYRQESLADWGGVFKRVNQDLIQRFGDIPVISDEVLSKAKAILEGKVKKAFSLLQQGLKEEAKAHFLEVLEQEPHHSDALQLLGALFGESRELEKALTYLNRALQLDPNNPSIFNNLGNILKELGRYEPAMQAYQQAIILKPNYSDAYFNLGDMLKDLGRHQDAQTQYEKAYLANTKVRSLYLERAKDIEQLLQKDSAVRVGRYHEKSGANLLSLRRFRFFGQRNNLGGGIHYSGFLDAAKDMSGFAKRIEEFNVLRGDEVARALDSSDIGDINIWFFKAPAYQLTKGVNVVWAIFESDKIPKEIIDWYLSADFVWVPSEWGRDILIANGVNSEKIDVIPEGVDGHHFNSFLRRDSSKTKPFKFLALGKFEKRKGYLELLTAFKLAFGNNKNVELVIKADFFKHQEEKNAQLLEFISSFKLDNVKLCSGNLNDEALLDLYLGCDAFVFPSRAEGWGLPLIEAAACGLPLISTFYSGHTEFLGHIESSLLKINHSLESIDDPVFQSYWPSSDGDYGNWARPSIDSISACMKEMMKSYPHYYSEAQKNSQIIREKFSWDKSWERAIQSLERRGYLWLE